MRADIEAIYMRGLQKLKQKERQAEDVKQGGLRGGSVGLYDEGQITGKCHRLALLRQQGLMVEMDADSRSLMFEAGHTSEDSWVKILESEGSYEIRREEDIPIKWEVNGIPVTGRPDIVLFKDGIAQHGIELKLVSSRWTALTVISGKPKCNHLVQSAHYSWQLGRLPWDLWYTSRVDWPSPEEWMHFVNKIPKYEEPGSEYMQWERVGKKMAQPDGTNKIIKIWKIKKVLPFRVGFTTRWNDSDELEYNLLRKDGSWTTTIITSQRIHDYYAYVSEMLPNKILGPRPVNLEADGSDGGFDPCGYCPMKAICEQKENDFDDWMSAAQELDKSNRSKLSLDLSV